MCKYFSTLAIIIFSSLSAFSADRTQSGSGFEKKIIDVDISGSVGNYNGQSYTEVHLGVNLNFTDWLTWRNSAFKRVSAGNQETSGLDSSLRLSYDVDDFSFYAGPGYRWSSTSDKNAIIGEAGASYHVGRVSLGAGAKYLRYDKAQFDSAGIELKRDDVSYFVSVSGGAGWTF